MTSPGDYATQLTALLVHKLGGHVVLTKADIDAAREQPGALALNVKELDGGLQLTIVNLSDALEPGA